MGLPEKSRDPAEFGARPGGELTLGRPAVDMRVAGDVQFCAYGVSVYAVRRPTGRVHLDPSDSTNFCRPAPISGLSGSMGLWSPRALDAAGVAVWPPHSRTPPHDRSRKCHPERVGRAVTDRGAVGVGHHGPRRAPLEPAWSTGLAGIRRIGADEMSYARDLIT